MLGLNFVPIGKKLLIVPLKKAMRDTIENCSIGIKIELTLYIHKPGIYQLIFAANT